MKQPIEIRDFKGLATNADLEDLPLGYLQTCTNMRPHNGKLVKTFGMGVFIAGTLAEDIKTLFTFINENLSTDFAYIGVYVNPATFVVTVYICIDEATWVAASTIFTMGSTTFYHKDATNPILQNDGILRILPGNVAEADGNQSKGIWIGHIEEDFFDGLWTIAEQAITGDAQFYAYPTNCTLPALTMTISQNAGTAMAADTYYYKFSYVYDGVQESLLTASPVSIALTANYFPQLAFQITYANHNKRVTALNVYRSDAPDGVYYKIHTIDFLRAAADVLGTAVGYYGAYWIYVPALTSFSFDANVDSDYALVIGGLTYELMDVTTGSGNTRFQIDATPINGGTAAPVTADIWDTAWALHKWNGGAYAATGQEGTTGGAYGGQATVITNYDTGSDTLIDELLLFFESATPAKRIITRNYDNAIKYTGSVVGTGATVKTWKVLRSGYGLYYAADNTTYAQYNFYDINLADGAEFPLADEPSIDVNGKYARIVNERLFQANIVLDPAGAQEVHESWVAYSEVGQYDVNPASNVIRIHSKDGGPITGLGELSGNPVFLFEHSDVIIETKTYPNEPKRWRIREVVHNIGNIADQGYITVLDQMFTIAEDGIYRLTAGNIAETDVVPVEKLKITDLIEDTYQAFTKAEKQSVIAAYDARKSEVLFYIGSDSGNQASGGTPSADSTNPTYPVAQAFDGNDLTWWQTENIALPHWLKYDLGAGNAKAITKIVMTHYTVIGNQIQDFLFQGSNNDTDWTTLLTITNAPNGAGTFSWRFVNSTAYRYYRVYITEVYGSSTVPMINELQLIQSSKQILAFNILEQAWRTIDTDANFNVAATDEEGNLIAYNDEDNKIYSLSESEAVGFSIKTPVFHISDIRFEPIGHIVVTYKSATALTINLYTERATSPGATYTLAVSTEWTTVRLGVHYRAKKFEVQIVDTTPGTGNTEIGRLLID